MDLMLLLGLFAMGGTLYALRFWDKRHANPDWLRLPTSEDELNARCCTCGSDKVVGHPQTGWPDHRYRHTCLACGKVLFRTEEPR
ncbi:hypothetical protein [Aeromonas aquatica]|uniref:hypothetical protein n=1 Tax=Aeromonas aquatica TaxID=558964 RepID=UPI00051B5AA8|nr:hypothetical protein [Aeromonas aquatica]